MLVDLMSGRLILWTFTFLQRNHIRFNLFFIPILTVEGIDELTVEGWI